MNLSVFPKGNSTISRLCNELPGILNLNGSERYHQLAGINFDLFIFTDMVDTSSKKDESLFFSNFSALTNCFYNRWSRVDKYHKLSLTLDTENYFAKVVAAIQEFHNYERYWSEQYELDDESFDTFTATKSPELFKTALEATITALESIKVFHQENHQDISPIQNSLNGFLILALINLVRENFIRHQRVCDVLLNTAWTNPEKIAKSEGLTKLIDNFSQHLSELMKKLGYSC